MSSILMLKFDWWLETSLIDDKISRNKWRYTDFAIVSLVLRAAKLVRGWLKNYKELISFYV